MKEATGEFSMTLVVILGAVLVVGILTFLFSGPDSPVRKYIDEQFKRVTTAVE